MPSSLLSVDHQHLRMKDKVGLTAPSHGHTPKQQWKRALTRPSEQDKDIKTPDRVFFLSAKIKDRMQVGKNTKLLLGLKEEHFQGQPAVQERFQLSPG